MTPLALAVVAAVAVMAAAVVVVAIAAGVVLCSAGGRKPHGEEVEPQLMLVLLMAGCLPLPLRWPSIEATRQSPIAFVVPHPLLRRQTRAPLVAAVAGTGAV